MAGVGWQEHQRSAEHTASQAPVLAGGLCQQPPSAHSHSRACHEPFAVPGLPLAAAAPLPAGLHLGTHARCACVICSPLTAASLRFPGPLPGQNASILFHFVLKEANRCYLCWPWEQANSIVYESRTVNWGCCDTGTKPFLSPKPCFFIRILRKCKYISLTGRIVKFGIYIIRFIAFFFFILVHLKAQQNAFWIFCLRSCLFLGKNKSVRQRTPNA